MTLGRGPRRLADSQTTTMSERSLPPTLRHELELTLADGDMVVVRGRFSGHGLPAPWIAVDTIRMEGGLLREH